MLNPKYWVRKPRLAAVVIILTLSMMGNYIIDKKYAFGDLNLQLIFVEVLLGICTGYICNSVLGPNDNPLSRAVRLLPYRFWSEKPPAIAIYLLHLFLCKADRE